MKLNLASGSHPLEGFVNLSKEGGWHFQDGLPFPEGSIEGITESHGLMYLPVVEWPEFFSACARVLEPGGVIRITEDATDDPRSPRFGGFDGAVTLTSGALVLQHLGDAGFYLHETGPTVTHFRDDSLMQNWHGGSPKCFFVEGVRP